jgi:hypothetical protein
MSDSGYKAYDPNKAEQGWKEPSYIGANAVWKGNPDDQYLRKWTLSLGKGPSGYHGGSGGQGDADLGASTIGPGAGVGDSEVITTETQGMDFRMTFKVRHADSDTPGTAEIRIYNLSNNTANKYIKEFDTVVLQAGYIHGHFGVIFQGTIKQFKKGRESAVDSYLDLYCADGDQAFNYSFLAESVPAGESVTDWQKRHAEAMQKAQPNTKIGYLDSSQTVGGIRPSVRGSVYWGLAKDGAKEIKRTTGNQFSIQNGVIQAVNSKTYAPGDTPIINSGTGMIGIPEVTQDGITVTCLLNPHMYVKQQVQLDNKSLNQFFAPGQDPNANGGGHPFQSTYGQYTMMPVLYADTSTDGKYTILVIDHEGDTRGQAWYTSLTCLAVDASAPFGKMIPGGTG